MTVVSTMAAAKASDTGIDATKEADRPILRAAIAVILEQIT